MGCRYFVVLLTEHGRHVVTERLPDGTAAWAEDARDVEERSSLAKIIDSADTRGMGVTVGTMRAHFTREAKETKKRCLGQIPSSMPTVSAVMRPADQSRFKL